MKGLCRVLTALKKCEYFSSFLFLPSPCLFILTPKVHLFEKTNTAIPTCPWASNYAHISFLHPPLQSVSLKVSLEMKADSAHDSRALKIKAGKKKKENQSRGHCLSYGNVRPHIQLVQGVFCQSPALCSIFPVDIAGQAAPVIVTRGPEKVCITSPHRNRTYDLVLISQSTQQTCL